MLAAIELAAQMAANRRSERHGGTVDQFSVHSAVRCAEEIRHVGSSQAPRAGALTLRPAGLAPLPARTLWH